MDNLAVATEPQRSAFGLIGTVLPLLIAAVMMPPPRLNVEPTQRVAGVGGTVSGSVDSKMTPR